METPYPISSKLIENFPLQPKICTYDLMFIETKNFSQLKGNPACNIYSAEDHKVLEDGIKVDITANQTEMGLDFAQRRINRKAEIYKDNNKEIQFFVCYCDGVPIGNIEYMPFNGMVKLEDFDIIEEHQSKGFGTSVLKHLLEIAYNDNIEIVYLITDSSDTAKEMYKKNGFMKIGEKTELLFFLE
ncbi:GNAT family N-acetyltransferase [Gracilibacillus massiliensis]|uniref:GNAT family N-acetyltransferase n=1 Tax=Gracilibacillus massiliensis TaxID=1564956 RepID=UPI00071E3515|nr:GNAT family N-acetyltransferase [Gracilibacillus massiliensis]